MSHLAVFIRGAAAASLVRLIPIDRHRAFLASSVVSFLPRLVGADDDDDFERGLLREHSYNRAIRPFRTVSIVVPGKERYTYRSLFLS